MTGIISPVAAALGIVPGAGHVITAGAGLGAGRTGGGA